MLTNGRKSVSGEDRFTIGQVAAQSGASVETLRYYARFGLLETPQRTSSNYRLYTNQTIEDVRFIRRAQELGFSLKDIKDLLCLHHSPSASSAEVKALSEALLADIDDRISTLQTMRETLSKLVEACSGKSTTAHCPILKGLQDHCCEDTDTRKNRSEVILDMSRKQL